MGLFSLHLRTRIAPAIIAPLIAPVIVLCMTQIFQTATFAADKIVVPSASNEDTLELAHLQERFQTLAQRVAPSVVAISVAVAPVDADDAVRSDDLNGQKLDTMLDHVTRSVGTGFVIDADGYILTNEHVISEAQQVWVTTDDHKVYPAIIVGSDPRCDLAVLKIPAAKLSTVSFAAASSVKRGEWTIALGNPYGLAGAGEMAMSVGVVSAVDRSLSRLSARENRMYTNLIQTTAQINPGNSGGPLFDIDGDVIGINTAVVMPQKQTNGIGFAMPITDDLLARVHELKAGHEIVYGYLGVVVNNPTPRQRRDAGSPEDVGVLVESVEENSPAAAASVQAGDMLLSIDSHPLTDSDQFVRVIGSAPVDRTIAMQVRREKQTLSLSTSLKRRPNSTGAVTLLSQRFRWRGLLLGPIPANWKPVKDEKPSSGVIIISIESDSPLRKDGLSSGEIITAIAGRPIADIVALQRVINDTPAEQCKLTLVKPVDNLASTNEP